MTRRKDDPSRPARVSPGVPAAFLESALRKAGAECIDWPFHSDRDGYGRLVVDGVSGRCNQIVCSRTHGERPTNQHHAAHSCGRTTCINPHHLSWKTPAKNEADKGVHGTRVRGEKQWLAKLTKEDIPTIRSSPLDFHALGRIYGVHWTTIRAVVRRKTWTWVP